MLTTKRIGTAMAVVLAATLGLAPKAGALTNSDRGAGLVIFPSIRVNTGLAPAQVEDTFVQLSNLGTTERTAKCFYVNANSHCSNTGAVCQDGFDCQGPPGFFGSCDPGWAVTDFFVVLTRGQPIGWRASEGLGGSDLPLTGPGICGEVDPATGEPIFTVPRACVSDAVCPGGLTCIVRPSNAGTLIPPTPEDPFDGALYCLEIDPTTGVPFEADNPNDLKGESSYHLISPLGVDVATNNAVGIRANGTSNGDTRVSIGADQIDGVPQPEEYQRCPSVLVLNHLFDNAVNPIDNNGRATTLLALAPCSADLTGAEPSLASSTAQFLVFNEFEQRFSTSRRINCWFKEVLSNIDTTQSVRSIFSAGVAGTVAGQTRIRGVGSGLVGSAQLFFLRSLTPWFGLVQSGLYNVHQDRGEREEGDHIIIP